MRVRTVFVYIDTEEKRILKRVDLSTPKMGYGSYFTYLHISSLKKKTVDIYFLITLRHRFQVSMGLHLTFN